MNDVDTDVMRMPAMALAAHEREFPTEPGAAIAPDDYGHPDDDHPHTLPAHLREYPDRGAWLTIAEAARAYGVPETTMRRGLVSGAIPGVQQVLTAQGVDWRIPRPALPVLPASSLPAAPPEAPPSVIPLALMDRLIAPFVAECSRLQTEIDRVQSEWRTDVQARSREMGRLRERLDKAQARVTALEAAARSAPALSAPQIASAELGKRLVAARARIAELEAAAQSPAPLPAADPDLQDLREQLATAQARIAELEAAPPAILAMGAPADETQELQQYLTDAEAFVGDLEAALRAELMAPAVDVEIHELQRRLMDAQTLVASWAAGAPPPVALVGESDVRELQRRLHDAQSLITILESTAAQLEAQVVGMPARPRRRWPWQRPRARAPYPLRAEP